MRYNDSQLLIDRLVLKILRLSSLFTFGAVQTRSYLAEEGYAICWKAVLLDRDAHTW